MHHMHTVFLKLVYYDDDDDDDDYYYYYYYYYARITFPELESTSCKFRQTVECLISSSCRLSCNTTIKRSRVHITGDRLVI